MNSKQSSLLEGVAGKIPHLKQNNGSDADMEYMLVMGNNIVQYINLIDIYTPCIVGSTNWNDVDNMKHHCGDNVSLFNQGVLSISDEAFLLVVLYNYSANWMPEIVIKNAMVRTLVCCMCNIVFTYPKKLEIYLTCCRDAHTNSIRPARSDRTLRRYAHNL